MNTENTSRDNSSQAETDKKSKSEVARLRGIPLGMLMQASEVRSELGIADETWQMWRSAGMCTISGKGTKSELVVTNAVFDFLLSDLALGERPSVIRKNRQNLRKQ